MTSSMLVSKLPEVNLVIGLVLEGSMRHLKAPKKENTNERNQKCEKSYANILA
jgi:hypothetical protein